MTLSRLIFAAAGALLAACSQPAAPEPETAATAVMETPGPGRIETLVDDWARTQDFSGNVLIAQGENIVHQAQFGLADREAGVPVDAETAYFIASLSKTFTVVLALQAVEAGQLSLDDRLDRWLPEFDAPYADQVTVRQLLQNRSGLPHYIDLPGWFTAEGKLAYSRDHLLQTLAGMPLRFEPGSEYYYANSNYYLLGLILDRAAGTSYEDQLSAQLLGPLGLSATGQIYQPDNSAPIAVNYLREDDGGLSRIDIVNPAVFRAAASLYAPASDLHAWGLALLGDDLLSAESRAVMLDPERPMSWTVAGIPVSDDGDTVEVQTYNGRIAGHTSMLTLIPQTGHIIIVMGNNSVGYNQLAGLTVELTAALHDDAG